MKLNRILAIILAIQVVAFGIMIAMPSQAQPQPVSAQQTDKYDGDCTGTETAGRCADKPIDHSYCQYPDRTTNPPNGCDNTDPCDPANVKGGSGECLPIEPVQYEVMEGK